jgi:hypothetical protein
MYNTESANPARLVLRTRRACPLDVTAAGPAPVVPVRQSTRKGQPQTFFARPPLAAAAPRSRVGCVRLLRTRGGSRAGQVADVPTTGEQQRGAARRIPKQAEAGVATERRLAPALHHLLTPPVDGAYGPTRRPPMGGLLQQSGYAALRSATPQRRAKARPRYLQAARRCSHSASGMLRAVTLLAGYRRSLKRFFPPPGGGMGSTSPPPPGGGGSERPTHPRNLP